MGRLTVFWRGVVALLIVVSTGAASVFESGGAAAEPATGLSARIDCSTDSLRVTFSWTPSRAGVQWLDVSSQGGSFAPGTFSGIGPLSSARSSHIWTDPRSSTTYHARVNTFDGENWAPTSSIELTTARCGQPAPSAAMLALQADLEAQIAAWNFETAVAVTDLQTGETISVNGNRLQFTGCTINLLPLMQTVIDLEAGRYEESQVGALISNTVRNSDPVTARDLLFIAGEGNQYAAMERVNALIERIGMTDTFYDHPPAFLPETLQGRQNFSTALDFNRALAELWDGSVMSLPWRDYLLDKMGEVKPGLNYLIPAGVTDGVVGHKNGFFVLSTGYIDNDAGIVRFERNGETYAYALTFMTQSVPTKYGDITLGQAVSSMVWQYFNQKYS